MKRFFRVIFWVFFIQTLGVTAQQPSSSSPLLFDAIDFNDRSFFLKVRKDGLDQFLHPYGLQLVDKIEESSGGFFEVVVGDAYGVLDREGNVIADFKYEAVSIKTDYNGQWQPGKAYNYRMVITKQGGKYGVIDAHGKEILKPSYDEITIIDSLTIAFRQEGQWGWLDARNGEVIQSPIYHKISKSYVLPGALEIHQQGKEGLASRDGQVLIAPEYDYLRSFPLPGKLAVYFTQGEKKGVMDDAGKIILFSPFDNLDTIGQTEVLKFTSKDGVGLWNMKEARILLEGFSSIGGFVEGKSIARKGQDYGIVDANGNVVVTPEYERINLVDARGLSINAQKDAIVKLTMDPDPAATQKSKVSSVRKPYYMIASKGGKQGVFDWDGKVVIPLDDHFIEILFKGEKTFFKVYRQEKYGLFDHNGKEILPSEFTSDKGLSMNYYAQASKYAENEIIPLTKNGKIGLYHAGLEKIIIPVTHDFVVWDRFDHVSVRQSLKEDEYRTETAIYDRVGKLILPYQENISYTLVAKDRVVESRRTDRQWSSQMKDIAGNTIYESNEWEDFKNTAITQLLLPKDTVVDAGFENGFLKIRGKADNLFIDREGVEKRFSDYAFVGDFSEDQAVAMVYTEPVKAGESTRSVREKERFGIINSRGEVVLPLVYEHMEAIYDAPDLLKVKKNDKWGIVTKKGKIVMEAAYDNLTFSSSSKLFVDIIKDGKRGVARKDGTVVIPPIYEQIHKNYYLDRNETPLFMVYDGEWYKFINEQGQLLNFRAKTRLGY